jgi:hypothetical protein
MTLTCSAHHRSDITIRSLSSTFWTEQVAPITKSCKRTTPLTLDRERK